MVGVDLAHYDDIRKWNPTVGDFIIWHGWFQHYFGVISNIVDNGQSVEIIKRGLPILLFDMVPEEYDQNKTNVSIGAIKSSKGGKYAIIRGSGNNIIWYV